MQKINDPKLPSLKRLIKLTLSRVNFTFQKDKAQVICIRSDKWNISDSTNITKVIKG